MELFFSGTVWHWRGPSPFHFVTVPDEESETLREIARSVTYGWGMIPVTAVVGTTTWTTSLFPKNGAYLLPLKNSVREAETIALDDVVAITLTVSL